MLRRARRNSHDWRCLPSNAPSGVSRYEDDTSTNSFLNHIVQKVSQSARAQDNGWGRREEGWGGTWLVDQPLSLEISAMDSAGNLAAAGARIVAELAGHWRHDRGTCLCPAHNDRVASLSVRVGDRTLLFHCFAGCDTTAVLAALRARNWIVPRQQDPVSTTAIKGASTARRAIQLWEQAVPLKGTIGASYLESRSLPVLPPGLRFHPRTPIGRGPMVQRRPALIAAVRGAQGISALHRTFLEPNGRGLATDLEQPRACLGRLWNGAVQLAPVSWELGLAEGIETALSATALLGIPVWAVLGSSRLHVIELPSQVRRLVLLSDNDRAGRVAALKAKAVYRGRGLDVGVEWPWHGLNDWNDVLKRQGEEREGWGG